jgi:hypothetical protein
LSDLSELLTFMGPYLQAGHGGRLANKSARIYGSAPAKST